MKLIRDQPPVVVDEPAALPAAPATRRHSAAPPAAAKSDHQSPEPKYLSTRRILQSPCLYHRPRQPLTTKVVRESLSQVTDSPRLRAYSLVAQKLEGQHSPCPYGGNWLQKMECASDEDGLVQRGSPSDPYIYCSSSRIRSQAQSTLSVDVAGVSPVGPTSDCASTHATVDWSAT